MSFLACFPLFYLTIRKSETPPLHPQMLLMFPQFFHAFASITLLPACRRLLLIFFVSALLNTIVETAEALQQCHRRAFIEEVLVTAFEFIGCVLAMKGRPTLFRASIHSFWSLKLVLYPWRVVVTWPGLVGPWEMVVNWSLELYPEMTDIDGSVLFMRNILKEYRWLSLFKSCRMKTLAMVEQWNSQVGGAFPNYCTNDCDGLKVIWGLVASTYCTTTACELYSLSVLKEPTVQFYTESQHSQSLPINVYCTIYIL